MMPPARSLSLLIALSICLTTVAVAQQSVPSTRPISPVNNGWEFIGPNSPAGRQGTPAATNSSRRAVESTPSRYPSTGLPSRAWNRPDHTQALQGLDGGRAEPARQQQATTIPVAPGSEQNDLAQPLSWQQEVAGERPTSRTNALRPPEEPRVENLPERTTTPAPVQLNTVPANVPAQQGTAPAAPIAQSGPETTTEGAATIDPSQEAPSIESLQERVKQVEAAEGLAEGSKTKQLEYLHKALEWRQVSQQAEKRTNQLKADIESAPQAIATAKAKLAETLPEPNITTSPDTTIVQLEQQLSDLEAQLSAANEALAKTTQQADAGQRTERKAEIARLLETAATQMTEVEKELQAGPLAEEEPAVADARRARLLTRKNALQWQAKLLESDKRRDDALTELYPLERDLAQRQVAWLQKAVEQGRNLVATQRKRETERQAVEARRKLSNAHPALKSFAERNAELTEQRKELTSLLSETSGNLEKTSARLEALKQDYQRVTNKVEVGGMTAAAGLLLRDRANHLPREAPYHERIAACGVEMQRVQLQMLELEEARGELGNIDELEEHIFQQVQADITTMGAEELRGTIRELLETRRQYVDDLLNDFKAYHEHLSDLELACRGLLAQRQEYAQYIDERVLWIRSESPLQVSDLSTAAAGLGTFSNEQDWSSVGGGMFRSLAKSPLLCGGIVLALIALFIFRSRMRSRLSRIGESAQHASSLWPTTQSVALTLLIALVWPLLFWFVGWLLMQSSGHGLAHELAFAFQVTALLFGTVEITRQICRPHGLGEEHFGWNHESLRRLHRGLSWLMLFGLPTVFVVTLCELHQDGDYKSSLGRLAFLLGTGLSTFAVHRLLRPSSGLINEMLQRARDFGAPLDGRPKLAYLAYVLGMSLPVSLMSLSVLGYSYSAYQLLYRVNLSLWLLVSLVLAHAMLSLACDIFRRRTAMRRHAALLAGHFGEGEENAEEAAVNEEDAQQTNEQLQHFLRGAFAFSLVIGAGFIWADMFPALGILNRVELWSTTQTVYETVTDADGGASQQAITKPVPVTLAHLLFCGLVVTGTLIAARSMPGLLQVMILRRLPIDSGGRHAIGLISRYLVTLFGLIAACSMLGVTWSSLQWLAAAMTVGLGFGLQEIFANLVSGVIILLERPIRVGDLVTVDGTSGTVTRMQIRATTITDFDRRELIVPNKKFITENVVNWTLTDPITRFVVPVGIAYDSDSTKARELLLQVAHEHPLVLSDPAPFALMVGFGDSTKNLELRAFLGSRSHYQEVLHAVLVSIENAFSAADIEIAFPQQEITIKRINGVETVEQTIIPQAKAA